MSNLNTEFQEPLTRPGVKHDEEMSICSSTPQVHGGYINSSLLDSDLKICDVDVVSFDENMSDDMSDLSIITKLYERNKHSLMNETAMERRTNIVTIDEIRRHQRTFAAIQEKKDCVKDVCTDSSLNICKNGDEEVFRRSRSKSKFTCKYAWRDREPLRLRFKKIIKMFQKSKSSIKRIKRYIMYNTPHSSAMKNFLSIDFRIDLVTRLCRSRPVRREISSAYSFMIHYIYNYCQKKN